MGTEGNPGESGVSPLEQSGDPVEDYTIYDGFDEDGNPMEIYSDDAFRSQIKEEVGMDPENTKVDPLVNRISDYIFKDLKASTPQDAIKILAALVDQERSSTTVPENILISIDRMIQRNKKVQGIESEYRRRQQMGTPF